MPIDFDVPIKTGEVCLSVHRCQYTQLLMILGHDGMAFKTYPNTDLQIFFLLSNVNDVKCSLLKVH